MNVFLYLPDVVSLLLIAADHWRPSLLSGATKRELSSVGKSVNKSRERRISILLSYEAIKARAFVPGLAAITSCIAALSQINFLAERLPVLAGLILVYTIDLLVVSRIPDDFTSEGFVEEFAKLRSIHTTLAFVYVLSILVVKVLAFY